MKLITETNENLLIEKVNKDLYVTGVFSSVNVKNKNGRTYERPLVEREIAKILPQMNNKSLYGQLNHPENPDINLEKVAIMTENLEWKGDDLIGKAKVLDKTYSGGILKGIIEGGGKVGISSRGLGTVSESGIVNDDFNLICWDIVSNASNPNSKYINGIYEGCEFSIKTEKILTENEIQEKAFKHIWQVMKQIEKNL